MTDYSQIYQKISDAKNGKNLETLVYDENVDVLITVAEQGYGLDVLINHEDPRVRRAVAKQGYKLEKLAYDDSPYVRQAVAEQGYIGILAVDFDQCVNYTVLDVLAKNREKNFEKELANKE